MNFRIVNSVPERIWSDFVEKHPEGNIFHTPEMFRVYQQVKGYKPEFWAAINANNQILALFIPVHISLFNGPLHNITTRTNVFGGILVNQNLEGEAALIELLRAYQIGSGKKSMFTEIRNISPVGRIMSTLTQLGFLYEEQLNFLIDLTPSPEAVFSRIGQRTRKNIRRALNQSKVRLVTVNDQVGVHQSYRLLSATYHHARVPLSDRSLFESAFELLSPKGLILISTALVDNIPAATSIELLYKDTITGWFAGMDRHFSSINVNELLMWHLFQFGINNGYKIYDFGGAGRSDKKYGVRDFKAKFGGELVNYGRNTWVPNRFKFQMSRLGYAAYQKIYGLSNS